jgi:hypothetical protein
MTNNLKCPKRAPDEAIGSIRESFPLVFVFSGKPLGFSGTLRR